MVTLSQVGIPIPMDSLIEICRRYEVQALSIFGSGARGELRADSDIDILVEFLPGHGMDLFDFGHLEDELSALLGRRIDLVSKHGLNPRMAPHILQEAQLLYAA